MTLFKSLTVHRWMNGSWQESKGGKRSCFRKKYYPKELLVFVYGIVGESLCIIFPGSECSMFVVDLCNMLILYVFVWVVCRLGIIILNPTVLSNTFNIILPNNQVVGYCCLNFS